MPFGDFTEEVAFWCDHDALPSLECWVDGLNVSLCRVGAGVRCGVELLDSGQSADAAYLLATLGQGGASVANRCRGALGRDPEEQSLKLLVWLPEPIMCEALMVAMGELIDQRAAWLSLVKPVGQPSRSPAMGRTVLSRWQEGVSRA